MYFSFILITKHNNDVKISVPSCDDGMKNGNEKGVDCGGSCHPCGRTIRNTLSNSILADLYNTYVFKDHDIHDMILQ